MNFKPLTFALGVSLLVHLSAGTSLLWMQGAQEGNLPEESIAVSSVNYESITPKEPIKTAAVMPVKVVPVMGEKKVSKTHAAAKPKHFQFSETELPSKALPVAVKPTSSAELLADPQKGKIFSSYFSTVKDRIYKTLKEKYALQAAGSGEVGLYFILDSDGRLAKVSVIGKGSTLDVSLKDLAVECLKSASPFNRFPRELQTDQIAFQVKIDFDETS